MMTGQVKANCGRLCRETAYLSKVRASALREMARELALLRALGYPKHLAGLSERFLDAANARRSVYAMEIRLPGTAEPEG
jgi:hypothetical protein